MTEAPPHDVLLIRVGPHVAALPVAAVVETLRPLPLAQLSRLPDFVLGLATIRGRAVPVVDLGALLGASGQARGRFVLLRLDQRQVALAVDEVLGLRKLDLGACGPLPPLLRAAAGMVGALGALDAELLWVLQAAGVVPPEVWESLARQEAHA